MKILKVTYLFFFAVFEIWTTSSSVIKLAAPGTSITLTCSLRGVHIWRFNDEVLFADQFKPSDIGYSNIRGEIVNTTISKLHIHSISIKNSGNYSCTVGQYAHVYYLLVNGTEATDASPTTKSVSLGSSITMLCFFQDKHVWRFNDEVVFADKFRPIDIGFHNFHGEFVNHTVSSIRIENFSLNNVGYYSCTAGRKELIYYLRVQELQLLVNGRGSKEFQYLIADVKYNVTCHVPQRLQQRKQIISLSSYHHNENHQEQVLYNNIIGINSAQMTVEIRANTLQSSFSCAKLDQNGDPYSPIKLTLDIFVTPSLLVQLGGRNLSIIYRAFLGETLFLNCIAFGSRPAVNVYWKEANEIKSLKIVTSENKFSKYLYNVQSQLKVKASKPILLTCGTEGFNGNYPIESHVFIDVEERKTWLFVPLVVVALLTVVLSVSFSIVIVLFLKKRSANLYAYPSDQQDAIDNFESIHYDETSITAEMSGQFTCAAERESNITSNDVKISSDNVTFLSRLYCGNIIDYWRGKASHSGEELDCICETLSENVERKDIDNFLLLEKSFRCLPKHANIVSFLGSVTDKVPYYVYREYVPNGSLREFLLRNYNPSEVTDDPDNSEEIYVNANENHLITFGKQIADAMDFLNSYQFNHPGLCANKVLLSSTLHCKLYDFWPRDLNSKRIIYLKKNPNPSTAWLPPESIFLQEYDSCSDVWTYGILLWEIFSLGDVPFQLKKSEEIEENIMNMKLLPRPSTCPTSMYNIMLSTWDKCRENRPTFAELKDRINSLDEISDVELRDVADRSVGYITVVSSKSV